MSWICPKCETENSDELSHCEVCDEPSPAFVLQSKRAQRAWYNATYQNTISGYEHYLLLYPNGRHADEAKNQIDELKRKEAAKEKAAWDNCCLVNMSSAYSKYIKEYPSGTYISEAKEKYKECKDKEDWSRASSTNTYSSYKWYLITHPHGNFVGNAKVIIRRLEEEERKHQQEESEREEKQWNRAKTLNTIESYRSYISFNPRGKYVSQANYQIEQLRNKKNKENDYNIALILVIAFIIAGILGFGIPAIVSSIEFNNSGSTNTYIQQPQKLEMNDYARSLESDINKQLKSLETAKQYNIGLDYNMKQNIGDKLKELSKYNSNKYKGYKERYDKL